MSADDWRQCPICHGLPEELRGGIEHLYGKIPEDEYTQLKEQWKEAIFITPVRVDYNYLINADLSISLEFMAECNMCHAKWKHRGVVNGK
jgi:hypothetical protein